MADEPASGDTVRMLPWEKLDEATVPDAGRMELFRRGQEFAIRVDGHQLMTSREHGTERELARLGCANLPEQGRVLVGGLGVGHTLAAALELVGPTGTVVVAELVPAVVRWNREYLGHLAGHPLEDERVEVFEGDVLELMRTSSSSFDAILLDVDNGPEGLTRDDNDTLYSTSGLKAATGALRPGGVLAVWSSGDSPRFTKRLKSSGYDAKAHRVRARKGKGARATVWVARLQ